MAAIMLLAAGPAKERMMPVKKTTTRITVSRLLLPVSNQEALTRASVSPQTR